MVKNKRRGKGGDLFFVRSETIVSCAVCILFGLLKKLGCERPLVFERGYFLHDFFSRLFALYIPPFSFFRLPPIFLLFFLLHVQRDLSRLGGDGGGKGRKRLF